MEAAAPPLELSDLSGIRSDKFGDLVLGELVRRER